MSIKIVTVVGARPQFIKAAAVSRAIRADRSGELREVIVHTGQHFDDNMSKVFFDELEIPAPDHDLEIAGGTHGAMTGRMLIAIEEVLVEERPDWVLVYGDTNSTLAGALAAAKLQLPVAHVEAGLRSFNRDMPEEINRIVTDRIASRLFCPTQAAVTQLEREGIREGVSWTGDVMYDVSLFYRDRARERSRILSELGLAPGSFVLATCHRAHNTDHPVRLAAIVSALSELSRQLPVVLPLHPRTRAAIDASGLRSRLAGVTVVEPLPFLDMVALEQAARLIVTDSGGVQKEAYFFRVPCLTLRDETEWTETVTAGWNTLVRVDDGAICERALDILSRSASDQTPSDNNCYGTGDAAGKIVANLAGRN